MELEVRHLRALCAIAESGSVRKAARQLGMTQPSLTTQLRRIEQAVGGELFTRGREGSKPTPLGRSVLGRARPIVAEMDALMNEVREAAGHASGGQRLRVGSTGSRTLSRWLRRLHERLPETDTTIHIDVSANALLQMLASNQLDAVYAHEVEGSPLNFPEGIETRVLLEREPQFMAVTERHPQVHKDEFDLMDLADDQWMVDPTVDGEWIGIRRLFATQELNPRVVHGDYMTAGDLVTAGEVITPCQPISVGRPGMAIRPIAGDPLAVRLVLAVRTGGTADIDVLFPELQHAYIEAAQDSAVYQSWLERHQTTLEGMLGMEDPTPTASVRG
ncbi:LysR family transcriptional regulator [Streptomyces sp. NPDC005438]|uniref:LysR family transcriptional regulator n=1 Tax=Streptomyces sp. NPDC005438 TaxID=3156880 RepID=UPI00339ED19D